MSEPLTTGAGATLTVTGMTFAGLLAGTDASIVIGAFIGAAIFVLEAHEFPVWKRLVFFIFSFALGALLAGFTASLISRVLFNLVEVDNIIGAIVTSATAVKIIIVLISRADNIDIPSFPKKGGD